MAAENQSKASPASTADSTAASSDKPSLPWGHRKRHMRLAMVLGVMLIALLGYGVYWMLWLRFTVSTDDAYVEARIVSVSSRLPGRVAEVKVQEGDEVEAGQVLVRLGREQMQIRFNRIQAELETAQARAQEMRAGTRKEELRIARIEIRMDKVKLNRQRDLLKRMRGLARAKAVSDQELQQQRAAVSLVRARLSMSNAKLKLLQAGNRKEVIARTEMELKVARANLEDARANLKDLTIVSPLSGVVTRQAVDVGEFVEEGQGLMQVVETDRSWVVANLEEGDIDKVRPGQRVEVEVDAYPGRKLKARVHSIYSATLSRFSLLSTTSASGSFIKVTQRVPIRIEWEETSLPPMYPGLNVAVYIDVSK